MAQIYENIIKVMNDCKAVGKDAYNPQQKYKYRGIDAVMNALNPAMCKNGVFVVPTVLDMKREERETKTGGTLIFSAVTVKYHFFAADGSFVECVVMGEGMDSGDKSINKAMSAAFKYACFQVFCIPTEEMKDSEQDSPEPAPKKTLKDKAAAVKKTEQKAPETIGEEKANALKQFLRDNGVHPEYVARCCKVSELKDISESCHSWIINNIADLKAKYEAWKQKQS